MTINYSLLFTCIKYVLKVVTFDDLINGVDINDCDDEVLRYKVYFELLKLSAKNDKQYEKVANRLLEETQLFHDKVLYLILQDFDENGVMDVIDDKKDDLNDQQYLNSCNALMESKKFKTHFEKNYFGM